jgi:monomeric isocitrate dehydrogenase
MKVFAVMLLMIISDIIIFGLVVPYVFKRVYKWYINRVSRQTVDVNPIVGFIGGVK